MTVTRELEIEYGGINVGGDSTEYLLDRSYRLEQGPDAAFVEFEFLAVGLDEDDFEGVCKEADEEFSRPFQNLKVRLGSATLVDYSHTDSTGFDARPVILKRGDPEDNGRSRTYRVRVDFGLPAIWNEDTPGMRVVRVNVDYSPSRRRTVTISGEFTAVGQTLARAQYVAEIDAYASDVLTEFGGTYELVNEPLTEATINDRTIRFQRTYQEIIKGQAASGTTDDAAIVDQSLTIGRREFNDGSAGEGTPFVTADVAYLAWIDKDETTDLAAKWAAIRAWVVSETQTALGLSGTALVSEDPRYFYDDNRIEATLVIVGIAGSGALSRFVETSDSYQTGKVFVPVWNDNNLSVYEYDGPATFIRTVTAITRYPSTRSLNDAARDEYGQRFQPEGTDEPFLSPKGGDTSGTAWRTIARDSSTKRSTIGTDTASIDVTDVIVRHTMRRIALVAGTTPSLGDGSATTPDGVGGG